MTDAADDWVEHGYDSLFRTLESTLPGLPPDARTRVITEAGQMMFQQVSDWHQTHWKTLTELDRGDPDHDAIEARILQLDEQMEAMLWRGLQRLGELRTRYAGET